MHSSDVTLPLLYSAGVVTSSLHADSQRILARSNFGLYTKESHMPGLVFCLAESDEPPICRIL